MKHHAVALLVLWWCLSLGCAPGEDGHDTPVDPTTTTTTTPPEPPSARCALPDIGRGERSCYITRARAGTRGATLGTSTGLILEMMIDDKDLVAISRNFLGVSRTCRALLGERVPPFFVNASELVPLAELGFLLHDGGREIGVSRTIVHPSMLSFIGEGEGLGRLQRPHRNCADAGDPWCGRTGVYSPTFEEFRSAVAAHLEEVREIDGRGNHLGFDGIRAWCNNQ